MKYVHHTSFSIHTATFCQSFVILNVKSTHPGHKSLRCVTGNRAQISREAGLQLISEVMDLYNLVNGKEVNDVDLVRILTKMMWKV